MTTVRPRSRWAALLLTVAFLGVAGCAGPQATEPVPTASVEQPQVLSDAQAETLAAMRFKNYAAGIAGFDGRLLGGESGDLRLAGWVDFVRHSGYARVTAHGAPAVLVLWNKEEVAFLDLVEPASAPQSAAAAAPPAVPPTGDWQRGAFDPTASELTRMLAALVLLSADRPENPLLLRQNGARYLGTEEVAGAPADRYSGVSAGGAAAGEPDLSSQYWLDADGVLVRFGLRVVGEELSTVDLLRTGEIPAELPAVDDVEAAHGD